jgi:hypothetical protein
MGSDLRPNVIIAGTPKGGTTSVFRYLASHPAICAADIKELRFFTRHLGRIDADALEAYSDHFRGCAATPMRLRLEASPNYLFQAPDIIDEMYAHVGEAKLVFLLREPVSRLVSLFASNQTATGRISQDIKFDEYLDICLGEGDISRLNADLIIARRMADRIHEGCYLTGLEAFFRVWPKERIFIGYFEDLIRKPRDMLGNLCSFLNINPSFYEEYEFTIENPTRAPHYPSLHRVLHGFSRRFERAINRAPAIRQGLRTIYNRLATDGRYDSGISTQARARLASWYAPKNSELRDFLLGHGMSIPSWLADSGR